MSAPDRDPPFDALLDFLKQSRGFDFSGYKRTSLERRFQRRMDAIGCRGYGEYVDYLEVHPEEYEQLFDTLLINVTDFFRDPVAWQSLRDTVLPELLKAKPPDEQIRVWSAGCASGQEAYSAAMVLAEALGEDAYRDRVKIYGTDVDEDALTTARHAIYSEKATQAVPEELREKYFEPADQQLVGVQLQQRCDLTIRHDRPSCPPPRQRLVLWAAPRKRSASRR
jgi:two-component system, chemotaxis family, CheB/CheR fusion protein